MLWLLPVLAFLVLINGAAYLAFGIDKRRAIAGEWRIREADLLLMALLGGSIGALAGRHVFRHKTRKEPFSTLLQLIAIVQIGTLIGWSVA